MTRTPRSLCGRYFATVAWTAVVMLGAAAQATAQTDPLIGVKRLPPNVVVVMDTSLSMLYDDEGNYYDVKTYNRSDDVTVATALGVTASSYRRIYQGLLFDTVNENNTKYRTSNIVAVQSSASGYGSFWTPTRFEMARAGVAQVVAENPNFVRWGLLKLRQQGEAWRATTTSSGCDRPVRVTDNSTVEAVTDSSPCSAGGSTNRFVVYTPSVTVANGSVAGPGDSVVFAVGSSSAASNIVAAMQQPVGSGVLIPAGLDTNSFADRPIYNALSDALTHITTASAITSDSCKACRNTVVVLLASGKDDGDAAYLTHASMTALASSFQAVGSPARRVPVIVVGLKPAGSDETELQAIAAASGGEYFRAESASDVAAALSHAVQLGFTKSADFQAARPSEYTFVSPVVGTVNLVNAKSKAGTSLPNTEVTSLAGSTSGETLPQRSNLLLTAGFELPGFDGRLRAFRTFRPELDATKSTGWKFVQDGTPLWPDLDDRPELAGLARTPLSPAARNIYTYLPDAAGSGQVVAFSAANAALLQPYLGSVDGEDLIEWVRAQPIGAVIGSTPAIMDAPSLDPPPDDAYGFPDSVGTFAGTYKDRRSMIFFGANDGMIHAVDARTGYEMWAFVPFNLLPKLRTLVDGQSVERFDYFVDSSPKVAEVKISGVWRSMLIIGQSYGGTFYQAFDVTEAGMGVDPSADDLGAVNGLLARFDTPNEGISFSWAFPRYSSFDPFVFYTNSSLGNDFPGGRVTLYGDLKSTASNVEKRVGFTFSDPAVGTVTLDRSVTGVMTGSGHFPNIEEHLPGRGGSAPRAGKAFFLLNAATGLPIGNPSGSSCSGTGCYDVGESTINGRKNTIQADVTASGEAGSPVVTRAYVGDSDGSYWRFTLSSSGAISATVLVDTTQPIYSSSALLFVGTTERYLFFGTGSDLLPNTAPGGGGTGTGTAFRLYGVKDSAGAGTVVFSKELSPKVLSSSSNLLTNGERPTSSPTVAGDIVFFTTTTDQATIACDTDAYSRLYAFTFLGTAAYDTNGSGTITNNESPIVATTTGRGTAPFIVDQHLFVSVTSSLGTGVAIFGDPEDFNNGVGQSGVRILSWREIR